MHRTITTLHEYRTLYPDSAAIPTLTQSGLLGLLLDRQRYKAANLARRQARWKSICTTPRNLCVGIWRALIVLGDREITLARYHQAHRSCRRRLCFALPLTVQTSAVGTNLKPLLIAMSDKIRSYAELRELIRLSLRANTRNGSNLTVTRPSVIPAKLGSPNYSDLRVRGKRRKHLFSSHLLTKRMFPKSADWDHDEDGFYRPSRSPGWNQLNH
jgi:hypothetical protein